MSIVIDQCFARQGSVPTDARFVRGPFRDEHREDSAAGLQAEDLYTFLLAHERHGRSEDLVVEGEKVAELPAGIWVHAKGGLYTNDGSVFKSHPYYSAARKPRCSYVSLDPVLRPGTRWSLREVDNFRERFVYLGPGFPIIWTDPLADQVSRHLGIPGLEKLYTYKDPECFLSGITQYLQN